MLLRARYGAPALLLEATIVRVPLRRGSNGFLTEAEALHPGRI